MNIEANARPDHANVSRLSIVSPDPVDDRPVCDPIHTFMLNGGPMMSVYPFDLVALVKELATLFRRDRVAAPRPIPPRPFASTWQFRLLVIAGVGLTLPLVAFGRLRPGIPHLEGVVQETHRTVLTALGYALMA